jgi:hypothetical protein
MEVGECSEFDFIKFSSQLLAEQLQTKGDGQLFLGHTLANILQLQ